MGQKVKKSSVRKTKGKRGRKLESEKKREDWKILKKNKLNLKLENEICSAGQVKIQRTVAANFSFDWKF